MRPFRFSSPPPPPNMKLVRWAAKQDFIHQYVLASVRGRFVSQLEMHHIVAMADEAFEKIESRGR